MSKNIITDKHADKHRQILKSSDGDQLAIEIATEGNGARVIGGLDVTKDVEVGGNIKVLGDTTIDGDITVLGSWTEEFSTAGVTLPEEGKLSWGTDDKFYITANLDSSVYDMTFRVYNVDVLTVTRPIANSGQVKVDAGTIGNYASNDFDSALDVNVILNSSTAIGSFVSDYSLIRGVATNTSIGTFDELYLLHLTGAAAFWVSNAGDVSLAATKKLFFDGGSSGTNGHTYIAESGDDVLDIYVGALNILKLDEGNDKVEVLGADLEVDATKKIYLDGGGDTYITETGADILDFYVGGDRVVRLTEDATGNVASFGTTSAGFIQNEPTYNASDTEVNFHTAGNKQFLTFGSGNITDLNLNFPDVSCSCTLLVKQDGTGSRTITNYKTFDQAGGNESTVKFAGGSNPTLTTTANKVDIFSFYWDNDNHTAYGVVSQNF